MAFIAIDLTAIVRKCKKSWNSNDDDDDSCPSDEAKCRNDYTTHMHKQTWTIVDHCSWTDLVNSHTLHVIVSHACDHVYRRVEPIHTTTMMEYFVSISSWCEI